MDHIPLGAVFRLRRSLGFGGGVTSKSGSHRDRVNLDGHITSGIDSDQIVAGGYCFPRQG